MLKSSLQVPTSFIKYHSLSVFQASELSKLAVVSAGTSERQIRSRDRKYVEYY